MVWSTLRTWWRWLSGLGSEVCYPHNVLFSGKDVNPNIFLAPAQWGRVWEGSLVPAREGCSNPGGPCGVACPQHGIWITEPPKGGGKTQDGGLTWEPLNVPDIVAAQKSAAQDTGHTSRMAVPCQHLEFATRESGLLECRDCGWSPPHAPSPSGLGSLLPGSDRRWSGTEEEPSPKASLTSSPKRIRKQKSSVVKPSAVGSGRSKECR